VAYTQFLTSTLTTFAGWIGKPGMILPTKAYGIDPALFARTYVTQHDKS